MTNSSLSYFRLSPLLEREIQMDDPMQIPVLTKTAYAQDLTTAIRWIRKHLYGQPDENGL
jgi:hypothetical protein